MKARIKNKIFNNRYRMNYTLGQVFEAVRGTIFWMRPGNGYKYFLSYQDGKVYKTVDGGVINGPVGCFVIGDSRLRSLLDFARRKNRKTKRNRQ
jgi:hypothetical protein